MPSCFPHASDPHTDHTLIQPQPDHAPAETSADGSSGSTPTNSLKFQRPTTGGHGRQCTASLRDATTPTTGEPAPACVIGPKGPIIVEPLGSTAVRPVGRTDSPPEGGHVWHAWGVLVRSDGGPLDGGPLRVWLYSLLKRPANKRVLRHDPQLRIGPSMPIILQMCAPKHATFV